MKGDIAPHSQGRVAHLLWRRRAVYPGVALFPVDAGGRPLARGEALSPDNLTASGTYSFLMYVNAPVDKYVTFPEYEGI